MKRLPAPLRKILPTGIVALTIGLFIYLFAKHPEYRHTLAATNFWVLLLILALYVVSLLCLNWMYDVTLQLCGKRLPGRENLLLTSYSTIVNFFGPLQSGPGVRAAYVKQKLHVALKDYTVTTFIYYAIVAIVSSLFILIGSGHHWPVALLLVLAVSVVSGSMLSLVYKRLRRHNSKSAFHPTAPLLSKLALATICQLGITVLIYYIELRAVHTGATLLQAIAYGGAANFALFVSLTPGAIGFREAFLEFSRQLHHIPTSGILAASVIDRSVYVILLGLLFVLTVGMHLGDKFKRVGKRSPG